MKKNRSNFAEEMKMETAMLRKQPLKAMTTLGLTLFVSMSAFATGPAPSLAQQSLSSGLGQKQVLQVSPRIDTSKLKLKDLVDINEVSGEPVLIKGSDLLKTTKTLRGGDGSGGADSALDKKGQKRLLDLIEQDELDYFSHLFDANQKSIREKLTRLYYVYFRENLAGINPIFNYCTDLPYKYWQVTGNHTMFVSVFLKAYGLGEPFQDDFTVCPHSSGAPGNFRTYGRFDLRYVQDFKTLKWAFTDLPLESIHDEGEIRISRPESKKQLAIQKDGLVVIQRQEFNELDNESKAALFTHEALLYTVSVLNPDLIQQQGTSLIRTYNRRLLRFFHEHDQLDRTQFPITISSVVEAFQALKIPVTKK